MLFTPEMEELLPNLGSKVRKHYKLLQKEFAQINEIEKADQKILRWAYDQIETMKPIYVGANMFIYQTMLAFLQMTVARGLEEEASEKAYRGFVMWSDKISLFKEREKWWLYADNVTSEKPES